MGGLGSQVLPGVQYMSNPKNSKRSIVKSLFNRREGERPEDADKLADIAATLEEISRQVQKEAKETLADDFFAPTHVLKPDPAPAGSDSAASPPGEKAARRHMLTPDQYEDIIENSLSVLDMASQIIDRNRAATSKLKKTPA